MCDMQMAFARMQIFNRCDIKWKAERHYELLNVQFLLLLNEASIFYLKNWIALRVFILGE